MWVTAVLVALRRLGEQTRILAASGQFLGSFNCSKFELTSQKVFGKLCFNILCPGQWDVALVLSSLNSVGPTLAHSDGGFGLVVHLVWFPQLHAAHRRCLVLFLFLSQPCMKKH